MSKTLHLDNYLLNRTIDLSYFITTNEFLYLFINDNDVLDIIINFLIENKDENVDLYLIKNFTFHIKENTYINLQRDSSRLELINFNFVEKEANPVLLHLKLVTDAGVELWNLEDLISDISDLRFESSLVEGKILIKSIPRNQNTENLVFQGIARIFATYEKQGNVYFEAYFNNKPFVRCALGDLKQVLYNFSDIMDKEEVNITFPLSAILDINEVT